MTALTTVEASPRLDQGHEFRVLCAHTSPDTRVLLEIGLPLDAGMTIDVVESGADAVVAASTVVYDAILLDESLDDLSWLDVCAWLAADESTRGVPVVLLTAATASLLPLHEIVVALVAQPITPRLLALQLRAALGR